jgi:putative tricarboxylic transport membrane protein
VSSSLIDVWIMLVMGGVGYVLRKLHYDLAPIALGLVLAPMLELSLRQSLAMSAGDYGIFLERPIAMTMFGLGVLLFLLALKPLIFKKSSDWRKNVGLEGEKS